MRSGSRLFSCWQTPIRALTARACRVMSRPKTLERSRRQRGKAVDHPDRGGLSRPVGAEDAEALPGVDRKGEVVDGDDVAEGLAEMFRAHDSVHLMPLPPKIPLPGRGEACQGSSAQRSCEADPCLNSADKMG